MPKFIIFEHHDPDDNTTEMRAINIDKIVRFVSSPDGKKTLIDFGNAGRTTIDVGYHDFVMAVDTAMSSPHSVIEIREEWVG